MTVIEEWIGSKKTATLGDLSLLQEYIHFDLTEMEERFGKKFLTKQEFLKEMARVHRTLESMMKILESLEGRQADTRDHGPRIRRLEKAIFFAK